MMQTETRFRPMYLELPHELIVGIAAALRKPPELLTVRDVREYIAAAIIRGVK